MVSMQEIIGSRRHQDDDKVIRKKKPRAPDLATSWLEDMPEEFGTARPLLD